MWRSTAATLAVAALGLIGADAASATITASGVTATITPSVAPTRLPAKSVAPVKLAVDGSVSCQERCASSLRAFSVRLDGRVLADVEGLPACRLGQIKNTFPPEARKNCGRALVGTGTIFSQTVSIPGQAPATTPPEQLLFFNGKGGTLIMHFSGGYASPVGAADDLTITLGTGIPISAFSFRFRLGKTWRYQGERHSYLNGRCASGSLRHTVTLEMAGGPVPESVAQPCTKRSG